MEFWKVDVVTISIKFNRPIIMKPNCLKARCTATKQIVLIIFWSLLLDTLYNKTMFFWKNKHVNEPIQRFLV